MTELINQAVGILSKGAELLKNPAISGAVSGMFGWMKDVLGKKSAKEKLELIEQNKHSDDTINTLKANLEFMLEDNDELQKQLADKVGEVTKLAEKEGIKNVTKYIDISIKGDKDIVLVDFKGGDLDLSIS